MCKHKIFRQHLTLALTLCLLLAGVAFGGGKSGKKQYQEGLKHEVQQQWDLAAQQFALAVAAEPDNAEYRLHLVRALQNASLMLLRRGDTLAEQEELASAYAAYKQAYAYDQTNEMARLKMERMLERQRAQSGASEKSGSDPGAGNIVPASAEVVAPQRPRSTDALQRLDYKDTSLKLVIRSLAQMLELNVMFDDSFKDNEKFSVSLRDVTQAKALDLILIQNKLVFEQLDRRTILIYPDNAQHRQRLERLLVKTFYLSNADLNETRALAQSVLAGGAGAAARFVTPVKQLNALVIRATPQELELIRQVIESVDKNRPEVVIDVDIYEVARSTTLEIGNQFLTAAPKNQPNIASLSNLGGVGAILGLPPSALSLLQTKGKSRLLASTQVHALDGQQNQTKVGESVPVSIGTNYVPGFNVVTPGAGAPLPGAGAGAFDSIQYRDVGLVIDVTPAITTGGYVEIKMKLESTSMVPGTDPNRPRFTQRTLATVSRVQDGKTAVVAGIKQESRGDTRTSIPVLGMLPFLGRFFTAPKQTSDLRDIVITVTPHIIRSAALEPDDHLARQGGAQQSGLTLSVEEVVRRAQSEDERDHRLNAAMRPAAPITSLGAARQTTEATRLPDR
jgi:general secretion pathway protein D